MEAAARKNKYKVLMVNSSYETESEIQAIESLREHGCQNIILHSDFSDDETLVKLVEEVPGLVIINRFIKDAANRCVWLDNEMGVELQQNIFLKKAIQR
ncbi:hypothetical protein RS130_09840 [Paraglaciecola aquimarina]|uniref:Periplasmic binding protein/LacI sugar binding domain-containing protein n=1 Tax=Paraglaciecola aquimarina TaxID=1235557 RepID=A0ABU3SVZ5_9ALTE|nr:hypothetical protein [Paraglaciecola aquimarina]MDU0354194.1 hypothetical protein [Paraglaciecola aquimarina]